MSNNCTKESFLEDVKDHEITIIKDKEVYRHIRMMTTGPNKWNQKYDIITWPDHLCYTGDMGTYVFQRTEDMFSFFRNEKMEISSGYWAEKCLSESIFGEGIRQWSVELFREAVLEYIMNVLDLETKEEIPEEYLEEAYSLLHAEDEWECISAYRDFNSELFDLTDLFDGFSGKEKTYHFIWCLYAIVFAIKKYDEKRGELES